MSNMPAHVVVQLHKVEDGERIIAFMVPTRVIRVTMRGTEDDPIFRVERFNWHSPAPMHNTAAVGAWATIAGTGNSLSKAFEFAIQAQQKLVQDATRRANKIQVPR